jgi:hypothetical protein
MIIEACGGPVLLLADPSADPALLTDGLIVLTGASGVALRGLTLQVPVAPVPSALLAALQNEAQTNGFANVGAVVGTPNAGFGVRAVSAEDLTLDGCTISVTGTAADGQDLFAAGLFVQGTSRGISVQNCTFQSAPAPTFTPIALVTNRASPLAADNFNRILERFSPAVLPASPQSPSPPPGASPPPSSPPAMPVLRIADSINTAFALLIAQRQALGADAPASPLIATVGIVAADYAAPTADTGAELSCRLGDALLRDNDFTNLTFATWVSATANTMRVQDNVISGGAAGLWLALSGAAAPRFPVPDSPNYYPGVEQFEEFMLASALAAAFPPPTNPAILSRVTEVNAAAVTRNAAAILLGPTEFTLFVLGNKIETQLAAGTALGQWGCSSALMLALNTGIPTFATTPPYISIIVSANHLRSAMGPHGPTALIVQPAQQPAAITGNVVLNYNAAVEANSRSPSLWVVSDTQVGSERLSIAGNSLSGRSDLSSLPRPDVLIGTVTLPTGQQLSVPLLGGWDAFNADPF